MADNHPELMQLPSVDDIHASHHIFKQTDDPEDPFPPRISSEGGSVVRLTACSSLDPHTVIHFMGGCKQYYGHSNGHVLHPIFLMSEALVPWPLSKVVSAKYATDDQIAEFCTQNGLIPLWRDRDGEVCPTPTLCDEQTLKKGAALLEKLHRTLQGSRREGTGSFSFREKDTESINLNAYVNDSHDFAREHVKHSTKYTGMDFRRAQLGEFTVWKPVIEPAPEYQAPSRIDESVSNCLEMSSHRLNRVTGHTRFGKWTVDPTGSRDRDKGSELDEKPPVPWSPI
jgi:hypothetical protein